MLDQFVTTASPLPRHQVDVAQSTTVLSGQSLLLKQQSSLGETLAAEPGMSATSFGAGASRPIIRGLGGDRIRLLENSVGMMDASVTSPDHAVSVEPFLVERIEIVRGPASLLYGSNAVGGVVNVITHRIETDLPTQRVRGGFEVRGGTGAHEFSRGGVLDLAARPDPSSALILHLDGFRRSTDEMRIPGFAESEELRNEDIARAMAAGEGPPAFVRGRLPNSAIDSDSGSVGLSFVSEHFHAGASYSGLESNYGVPGHAHEGANGPRLNLRQRRADFQAEWHGESGFLRGARLKFGQARYRHAEVEPDGAVGTLFRNRGYDGRLELLHGDAKAWSGAIGLQGSRSNFSATGEEAFLPPSITETHALFAFEELSRGTVTWQFGGRLEGTAVAPKNGRRKRFGEFSGSAGAVWKRSEALTLALSVTHTGRAPNAQELFADGPHLGTQAFEMGDPRLEAERSLGIEASARRRTELVTGSFTLFSHAFRGFIFEQPTGRVAYAEQGSWRFADAATQVEDALPVYRYVQRNARFWGAELDTLWHLHETRHGQIDIRFAADLTRGREGARELPRIPARRITLGVSWHRGPWSAGAETQWVMAQRHVAPNETPSRGYAVLSAHLWRTVTFQHFTCDVFLRGTNLADEEIRPHTSFVKSLAPLAGRAATAGVRMRF